ncbi:M16 family metallopeptidase [Clostridium sp. 'White wine YQ']|uniref:M16 family metallopeptidase n=1 Tax=Clostridium sp. 'White wine YQ' TaxID=3027474 RepID=UPI0023673758|nr:pitrilysin family protein [Clostridium sp. 'White wine YQ']MDD7795193.1 pitrilysin family protein [Clostridium sp. 'White wine YQ']
MYEVLSFCLSNGLNVVMHKIPKTNIMSCGIWIKQGSKYEDDETNGISHLIEHLVVSSSNTNNDKYREIMNEITFNGVEYNATTTKEHTHYYFTGINTMLPTCLDALANIVLYNSDISSEKFELEKKIVLNEASNFYSSFNQITERTSQALWGNLDVGRIIVGSSKCINDITLDRVKEVIHESYTPENSTLVIIGDIDYDDVLDLIEKKFGCWEDIETRKYSELINSESSIYINSDNKGINTAFSIGFRLNDTHSETNSTVDIISTILGYSGLESRIVNEVRIKRGLAYSLNSFTSIYSKRGNLAFAGICGNSNVEQVMELILNEIRKAKTEGFTESEISKAKNILKTRAIISMNDLTKHIRFLANNAINNKVFSLENEIRKINKCTDFMINDAMNDIFINDNIGMAAIGRFNSDKVVEILKI